MMKSTINYIVFSDVHFGHRRTPTVFIIDNLKTTLEPLLNDDLDIVFIAGDLYDRLLDNSMPENIHVKLWIHWLLKRCARFNIKLRVLEGTPSHDRKQSTYIDVVKSISSIELDYQYINALSIEHDDDLGIDILYIPDEWHEDPNETLKQVKTLLKEKGLITVDLVIMHGQFAYQIPNAPASIPKHNEASYLDITKHYIHPGHVHKHSVFERIVAQGSFDRLAHGEEEPKGLIWASISSSGQHHWHFIENKNAFIYRTITVRARTIEDILSYLDKHILRYPAGSYIRIKAIKDHLVFSHFEDIKNRYIVYRLSKHGVEEDTPYLIIDSQADDLTHQCFSISSENIEQLMTESISSKTPLPYTDRHWKYFKQFLSEAMSDV